MNELNFYEIFTIGMLYRLTGAITGSFDLKRNPDSNPEFLTVITKPLTEKIVQVKSFVIVIFSFYETIFSLI